MPYKMTAPPFFVTMFFEDLGEKEGWTENMWVNATGPTDYDGALATIQNKLYPFRRRCLPKDIVISNVRISNANLKNDARDWIPPESTTKTLPNYNVYTGSQADAVADRVAAYVRLENATPTNRGFIVLRGIPADAFDTVLSARKLDWGSLWGIQAQLYLDKVSTYCSVVNRPLTLTGINIYLNVTTINGTYTHTVIDTSGLQAGCTCTGPAFSGRTKITTINSLTTFSTNRPCIANGSNIVHFRGGEQGNVTANPIARYILPPFARYRATGRPFDLLRGRRKNR